MENNDVICGCGVRYDSSTHSENCPHPAKSALAATPPIPATVPTPVAADAVVQEGEVLQFHPPKA